MAQGAEIRNMEEDFVHLVGLLSAVKIRALIEQDVVIDAAIEDLELLSNANLLLLHLCFHFFFLFPLIWLLSLFISQTYLIL